jgi:hypothetical protein
LDDLGQGEKKNAMMKEFEEFEGFEGCEEFEREAT